MPGSRRSWHVGAGTCQDRGEAGKLEAERARIAAKLASWRRNLPGSRRRNYGGQKNLKKNVLLASLNSQLVERGYFSGIPNLNASTARGRFARTVGGGSIRQ